MECSRARKRLRDERVSEGNGHGIGHEGSACDIENNNGRERGWHHRHNGCGGCRWGCIRHNTRPEVDLPVIVEGINRGRETYSRSCWQASHIAYALNEKIQQFIVLRM